MTNKIYYQSKNPIACIAFANWCYNNFNQSTIKERGNEKIYYAYLGNATKLFGQRYYTMLELYQIWEQQEVDKTLAIDEI